MKKIIQCCFCMGISMHEESQEFGKCTNCGEELWVGAVDPVKALSIKQPWAWAIVNGLKDIENRSWKTKFTGTVLIHAGKKFDNEGYRFLKNAFHQANKLHLLPLKSEFENWMGGVCGSVDIAGCVTESKSPWFFGPYGFTLKNAKMMDIVKCKGQLGFFTPKID